MAYFVTLVCHQQACLWGKVADGELLASAGGEMVSAALAGTPLLRARYLRSVDAGMRVARTSTEILTGTQSSLFIGSVPVYGFPLAPAAEARAIPIGRGHRSNLKLRGSLLLYRGWAPGSKRTPPRATMDRTVWLPARAGRNRSGLPRVPDHRGQRIGSGSPGAIACSVYTLAEDVERTTLTTPVSAGRADARLAPSGRLSPADG
jgi:hypothetical protein